MKILLVGALGNMGRRYKACLNHLGHKDVLELDAHDFGIGLNMAVAQSSHCIVTTPTDTHGHIISEICRVADGHKIDILCEKPITTSLLELREIKKTVLMNQWTMLYMVNQYCYLPQFEFFHHRDGITWYDYYHSGNDGLNWDCFQLIALANGKVELANQSPVWTAGINGVPLDKRDMDQAYVDMLADFLSEKKRCWDLNDVQKMHEKCTEMNQKLS